MVKNTLVSLTLCVSLAFIGCSSDSPSDIAVKYVEAISDLDIDDAKELSVSQNDLKALRVAHRQRSIKSKRSFQNFQDPNKSVRKSKTK